MPKSLASILLLLALRATQSCATPLDSSSVIDGVLRASDQVTLVSLEPEAAYRRDSDGECIAPCVHGWPVIGSASLVSDEEVSKVIGELARWASAPEPEEVPLCFNPRHAVLVHGQGRHLQFVVCYQCDQVQVYSGEFDEPIAELYLHSSPGAFDSILNANGIKLAVQPKAEK